MAFFLCVCVCSYNVGMAVFVCVDKGFVLCNLSRKPVVIQNAVYVILALKITIMVSQWGERESEAMRVKS